MREKFSPFVAAIFCAFLCFITVFGNISLTIYTKGMAKGGLDVVFYCFLPMCFLYVGYFVSQLRQEQVELKRRIDALEAATAAKNPAT